MDWLHQIFGLFRSFQFWVTIAPWEAALRVRLGKHAVKLGPGIHIRVPFLDRMFIVATRPRTIISVGQTITTRDLQPLTINVAVTYAVADVAVLYMACSNPEESLLCRVQGEISDFVAGLDRVELSSRIIEDAIGPKVPNSEWGLSEVRLMITTFTYAKPLRILNSEWRSLSNLDNL